MVEALEMRGNELNLNYAARTAQFIDLIMKWWHIVNAKSPSKGQRLRDPLQDPARSLTDKQTKFLNNFVDWLVRMDTGALTTKTHVALRLTWYSLEELCRYCHEEANFNYVLLGEFQPGSLKERFRLVPSAPWNKWPDMNTASLWVRKEAEATNGLVLPDMQEIQKPCAIRFDRALLT